MSTCPYCTETAPDGEACYQPHSDLVCTRKPGHDGPHVACAIHEHQTETWGDPMSITDRARAEARDRYRIQRMEPVQTLSEHKMDAFMEGAEWAVSQPVTDEEVKAALNADYAIRHPHTIPADSLEPYKGETVRIMRAALAAAQRARSEA